MVSRHTDYYRKKVFLIFIALYLSFGYSVHHLIFYGNLRENYSVIPISGHIGNMSDMTGFASLIERGHSITTGDLFTKEFENTSGITPNISIFIIKSFSFLFGGIRNAFIILNFLMPMIYIFLIFIFFRIVLKINYTSSLLAGVLMLTLTDITNSVFNFHFNNIFNAFFNFAGGKYQYSYFGRLPHIQISFVFILLFLMIFTLSILKRKIILFVTAGLLYGLLFYVYFYYWVYVTIFLGVFIFISLFRKNKKDLIGSIVVLFTGIAIGSYYMYLYVHLHSLPVYKDYILKLGIICIRSLEKKSIVEAAMAIAAIIMIRKGKLKTIDYIIISFISAIAFAMNIQLVTGYTIEPEHFRITVWTPFFILFSVYYLSSYFKSEYKRIYLVIAFLLPLLPVINNVNFAHKSMKCYEKKSDVEEICNYIKNNENNRIVATDDIFLNAALSRETKNPLYISNGFYNFLSADEIIKRESIILKLTNRDEKYLDSLFIKASIDAVCGRSNGDYDIRAWMFYFLHTYYFDYRRNGFFITPLLMENINEIYEESHIQNAKFDILITKYGLSELYNRYFKLIYNSGEYSVYKRSSLFINP